MAEKKYQTAGLRHLTAYLRRVASEPPKSAEEIFSAMEKEGIAPGRSSVYRMLSALCLEGEVRKFRVTDGHTYQYVGAARDCEGHLHLQCLVCGGVTHLECACSDELTEHIFREHGFSVHRGKSVIYGVCAACAGKGKDNVGENS